MEILDVIARAQRLDGALPAARPHGVAELVAAGLARQGAVAFNLSRRASRRIAAHRDKGLDGPFPTPAEMEQAGIDLAPKAGIREADNMVPRY